MDFFNSIKKKIPPKFPCNSLLLGGSRLFRLWKRASVLGQDSHVKGWEL